MPNTNRKRVVAKTRMEQVAEILNRSANEAKAIHEFMWMVEDRVRATDLPESYHRPLFDKGFLAKMYQRYKDAGYCVKPDELRTIERVINEPDSN